MKLQLLLPFLLLGFFSALGQTKVSGHVFDENNQPIPFANVLFKGSTEGTITNEDGRFYLESNEKWSTLIVSFMGFEMLEIPLTKSVNYDLKFILKEEASTLDEVHIVTGKQSKKPPRILLSEFLRRFGNVSI